jgi:hypothetical protein
LRKWQDLAAPDDPNSWYDVDGLWPTVRESYESVHFLGATADIAATGVGTSSPTYAWAGQTQAGGTVEFILVPFATKIYSYSGASLSDVTGAYVSSGLNAGHFAQFGNVTIGAMGSHKGTDAGGATIFSNGGAAFAALAAAPQADIVVVQSGAVGLFSTGSNAQDSWSFSDVGDYTNWTTGEHASGTLYQTSGAITAAVAFQGDVLVFKSDAIYRFRYVGGTVKWTVELLVKGIGCISKDAVCAGRDGVLFVAATDSSTAYHATNPQCQVYWFDGTTYPKRVNPLTSVAAVLVGSSPSPGPYITYAPTLDMFSIYISGTMYFYCDLTGAWGISRSPGGSGRPLMGSFGARRIADQSPMPAMWTAGSTSGNLKRYQVSTPVETNASACYAETTKIGKQDRKTTFGRVYTTLRRRTARPFGGADAATLTLSLFRKLQDTSAQSTQTVSEDSTYQRFDLLGGTATDNFARFKVTWTSPDVEVDDFPVESTDAGAN